METRGHWTEEHWDLIAVVAALVLAVAVSAALGVGYNVATARLDAPRPAALELRQPPPSDPAPDSDPLTSDDRGAPRLT